VLDLDLDDVLADVPTDADLDGWVVADVEATSLNQVQQDVAKCLAKARPLVVGWRRRGG